MTGGPSDFSKTLGRITDASFPETSGANSVRLTIAGKFSCRIRFFSETLRSAFLPALNGILSSGPAEDTPPDFTFDCWESSVCGFPMPPWPFGDGDVRGGVVRQFDGESAAYFSHESGAFSYLDVPSRRGFFWLSKASDLQGYERAAPLLQLFHWALGFRGLHVTHAAAVATEGGAALLVGRGGSGKSTSAALCHEAGMRHLCDDYCVLSMDGDPRVHSLFGTAKLHPRSLLLPPLQSWSARKAWTSDDKAVVLLSTAHAPSPRLKVILLPSVTGRGIASLRPASPGESLRSLAPSSLFQLKGGEASSFALYSRLVRSIPSRHLDLGDHPETVAGRIREAIEEA